MRYFILLIVILTIILYLIYKDFLKVLKISSIVSAISGIITVIIGFVIRFFINANISFINISKITDLIVSMFLRNGIYLFILSLIELCFYIAIKYYIFRNKELSGV